MAVDTILYQKKVGPVRLEIAQSLGETLGSVYYESPDGRFDAGHLDLALSAIEAIVEQLSRRDAVERVFIGPFEPVVPPDSGALPAARAMYERFQARLADRPRELLGVESPFSGVWLDLQPAQELLRDLQAGSQGVSLEASALRLVLMGSATGASGWDVLHRDGGTHLGRWDGNARERPAGVDAAGRPVLQAALEAARARLERRLGGP